jgi:hypothetical protein
MVAILVTSKGSVPVRQLVKLILKKRIRNAASYRPNVLDRIMALIEDRAWFEDSDFINHVERLIVDEESAKTVH